MEGFKDLFQGGNCNPNQQAQLQSNNAFKNFMNGLITTPQQLNQFQNIQQAQNIDMLTQEFNNAWNMEKTNFDAQKAEQMRQMQEMWRQDQLRKQAMISQQKQNTVFNNQPIQTAPVMVPMKNWSAEYLPTTKKQKEV